MNLRTLAILLILATFAAACGQAYLRTEDHYDNEVGFKIDDDAKIADTTANRQVIDVLVQYRRALVRKDVGSLRRLISERYYDNGATTDTTRDDYANDQLPAVFELMAQHTDQIKYDVTVKAVEVKERAAYVDYEFEYAYEYTIGEAPPSWDAGLDVNRLELEAEDGEWKIVSGL